MQVCARGAGDVQKVQWTFPYRRRIAVRVSVRTSVRPLVRSFVRSFVRPSVLACAHACTCVTCVRVRALPLRPWTDTPMNFWSSIHERGNEDGQRPTDRPIDFFFFSHDL